MSACGHLGNLINNSMLPVLSGASNQDKPEERHR